MLKRDQRDAEEVPKTPVSDTKKLRESFSQQELRTPLKNLTTGAASFDFISPRKPGEDDEERRKNRAELVKRQQESRESLKSPSAGFSPRAEPSSSITPNLKKSLSGTIDRTTQQPNQNQNSSPNYLTAQGSRSILTASKSKLSLSSTRLNSSQPPVALTIEQMTKTFDEWMKMAADNKINSKNSWNFALIDYFSELTFLREGDSINFQKASCTLDGCVKIYASRVDSVVDETTKLLNGLSDKSSKFVASLEEEEEEDGGNEDGCGPSKSKSKYLKKSTVRTVETIEKNPDNLILKNFDLEFSIDPLFKKTSAEFDESGTKGALLKNLQCSPINNLVIFDSSDQIPMDFAIGPDQFSNAEDENESVDISLLLSAYGSSLVDLESKSICPTFQNYNFNSSLKDIKGTLEKLSKLSATVTALENVPQAQSEADVEDDLIAAIENDDENGYENADFGADDDGFYDGGNENENENETGELEDQNNEDGVSKVKSVKWASEVTDETGLSYFDGAFKQTWAGPEHWKIRKSQRIPTAVPAANFSQDMKSKRNSKTEKVAIDFASSSVDFRQIFSKPSSSGQISLTKAAIMERNENDHLLPDDLHFSSTSLLKLFIKPNWKFMQSTVKKGGRAMRSSSAKSSEPTGNFVEKDFWIAREAHQNGLYQESEDFGFENDFYRDEDDEDRETELGREYNNNDNNNNNNGNAFDNDENAVVDNNEILVDFNKNLIAAPKFIAAQQINYARVAKRVDVAKLKSTLWNEFNSGKSTNQKTSKSTPSPSESKFSSLINNLSKSYPSESLADVSVPYCFICLLHLANEKNLEIRTNGSDLIINEN